MSKALKWVVVKAASAAARNVSTVFFQLYYRELYRQVYDICKDPKETVRMTRSLGFHSAQESAQRRKAVLRLFPKSPEKLLGYLPLLWEIYFGTPMGDHKKKWDKSDPTRPTLHYIVEENPLIFGHNEDPENDNLPLSEFWADEEGYLSFMTGLLSQVVNFVLLLKEKDERIILKHTKSYLHGDHQFVLSATIVPHEEYSPSKMDFDKKKATRQGKKQPISENVWEKLTESISIDKIEEIFESPTSGMKILLRNVSEKVLHMEIKEVLGHFTNYEEEFFKVLGWLFIHVINEIGRIPEKIFKNEQAAKIYGHVFLFLNKNPSAFIPLSVITDFRDYFANIFEEMGGDRFVVRYRQFDAKEMIDLMFAGAKKALMDLGVKFEGLKDSFYQEIQGFDQEKTPYRNIQVQNEELKAKSEKKQLLMEKLFEQILLVFTNLLSIPSQLSLLLAYNALSSGNEIFVNSFNTIKDAGEEITEIIDEMNVL